MVAEPSGFDSSGRGGGGQNEIFFFFLSTCTSIIMFVSKHIIKLSSLFLVYLVTGTATLFVGSIFGNLKISLVSFFLNFILF